MLGLGNTFVKISHTAITSAALVCISYDKFVLLLKIIQQVIGMVLIQNVQGQ